ncbi:MAG TPA: SCP2 sterol-binding domain-containing protein [Thermoplasmata archaeon]|nr:SCP2 sterol-binding domain-containing protein [Thermoplasmata archaeon]
MRFLSQEWADRFRETLNARASYREAAAAWRGEILLLVTRDATAPAGEGIVLDLADGSCRSATYVADAELRATEFVYEGSRDAWRRLLGGALDPVKALFGGTFRIRGNLAKAARFSRAASELVACVREVPAEI